MNIVFQTEDAAGLWEMPSHSVLSLAGGGGKTTLLHHLAQYYMQKGFRVLTGTTTHMLLENGVCFSKEAVLSSLASCGYAMGGLPDPDNPRKMIGFSYEIWRELSEHADLTILEADGSRHLPFKVPKSHEPCVPSFSTEICVLFGSKAIGRTVREAAYNPEGVILTLQHLGYCLAENPLDTILTEEMIRAALKASYGRIFAGTPSNPVFYIMKAVMS